MPDEQIRLSKAQRLRAEAEKIRRSAMVSTTGGHGIDQTLLLAAARLERQADELDAAERLFDRNG